MIHPTEAERVERRTVTLTLEMGTKDAIDVGVTLLDEMLHAMCERFARDEFTFEMKTHHAVRMVRKTADLF